MEEFVHPKDKAMVMSDMNKFLTEKATSVRMTFRVQSPSSQAKWALLKGKLIIDEKTKDELFYLTIYDVTGKKFKAGNDPETNLLNFEFFLKKLTSAINNPSEHKNIALIGINISNFQALLDGYGSQFSTIIFQEVGALLTILLGDESELARISSKNFIGVVCNFEDEADLRMLTNAIIKTFKEPLPISGRYIRVEINLGVNTYPEDSKEPTELFMFNEYVTLQAQNKGIYQTTFFNEEMKTIFYKKIMIQRELADAFQNDEFYLVYQPQVNSSTHQIIGVEVLVRWNNATLGEVSPRDFIPIAEHNGYMVNLGQAILEQSIKTAKNWYQRDFHFGALTINVSPVELNSHQYIDTLIALCRDYQLPTHLIKLEITEGIYMNSIENSFEVLDKLIWHGFKIMVDDFGVGYSNLSFLSRAELDTLKIDKSLIDNIGNALGYSVVEGIITLANNLNYNVMAEGVETKEQVEILSKLGCHWIQGFYYSKPLSLNKIEKIIEKGFIQ